MLLRKILILPILVFGAVAFLNLILGNFFNFSLWSFLTVILIFSIFPLLFKHNEKTLPIYYIFGSMFLFSIFASIVAFLDFQQSGASSVAESTIFAILIGPTIVAGIMLLKGQK